MGSNHIKSSSKDALFGSLKETFMLGTHEFSKSVGNLFNAQKKEAGLQKNQIGHGLDKREKELQKNRI